MHVQHQSVGFLAFLNQVLTPFASGDTQPALQGFWPLARDNDALNALVDGPCFVLFKLLPPHSRQFGLGVRALTAAARRL
jgi:hypothetical protein